MIEIKYWDDSDICGFVYSTGYRNIIRLEAEFLEREYPYTEEGTENGDLEVIKHFQKVVREYVSTPLLVTPQQRAALEKVQLHRYIQVQLTNGDKQFVTNFKVETQQAAEHREHVLIVIHFQAWYEINRSKRVTMIQPCDEDRLANVDYVIGSALELPLIQPFYEGMRVLNTSAIAHKDVWAYNSATGQWVRQHEVHIEAFLTNNADGLEYYFDGNNWRISPSIASIVHQSGDVYKVKGYARRGFVRLEYSEDGGLTWATLQEYTSGQFKAGVLVTLTNTYDYIRAVSYTHSCLITEGAAEANPNVADLITLSGLPLDEFVTVIGMPSDSDSFTITEGVDATSDVTVTAPNYLQVSVDGQTWHNAIVVTFGYVTQDIYVRATGEAAGSYNGNLTVEVDGKTYNVYVSAKVECSVQWIEDRLEAINGEDMGVLGDDIARVEAVKDEIKDAIIDMGGDVSPTDTFFSYGNKIRYGLAVEGWYPPTEWNWDAAAALIDDGDNGFVGLYACYQGVTNCVAIRATFTGTASIDLGDGTPPQPVISNVLKEIEIDYSGITTPVTSEGYKVAVVRLSVNGVLSVLDFGIRHPMNRTNTETHWLALKIRSTHSGFLPFEYRHSSQVFPHNLSILDFSNSLVIRTLGMFQNHKSLQKLIYNFSLNSGTSSNSSLFSKSNIYGIDWNSYNWEGWTSLAWAWFNVYSAIAYSLNISIAACTNISSAFRQGKCFATIKLNNTTNLTNISFAIYNNTQTMYFEMDDSANVINTQNFLFNKGNNLKALKLHGLRVGIDLTNGNMQANELNEFMHSLGLANGSQTIIVTGNPGASTCDTTIATNKGFTVIT